MQRNEVSGFLDGSHIYKMDFWGYKRSLCSFFYVRFSKMNMNAQVGYASGLKEFGSNRVLLGKAHLF